MGPWRVPAAVLVHAPTQSVAGDPSQGAAGDPSLGAAGDPPCVHVLHPSQLASAHGKSFAEARNGGAPARGVTAWIGQVLTMESFVAEGDEHGTSGAGSSHGIRGLVRGQRVVMYTIAC